jgi:RimJ/RimL family protein N-acetyltransferase
MRVAAIFVAGASTEGQKALDGAGFTPEGVIRGGAWRDGISYSILRTDVSA